MVSRHPNKSLYNIPGVCASHCHVHSNWGGSMPPAAHPGVLHRVRAAYKEQINESPRKQCPQHLSPGSPTSREARAMQECPKSVVANYWEFPCISTHLFTQERTCPQLPFIPVRSQQVISNVNLPTFSPKCNLLHPPP